MLPGRLTGSSVLFRNVSRHRLYSDVSQKTVFPINTSVRISSQANRLAPTFRKKMLRPSSENSVNMEETNSSKTLLLSY
jgi:hypothetical protein